MYLIGKQKSTSSDFLVLRYLYKGLSRYIIPYTSCTTGIPLSDGVPPLVVSKYDFTSQMFSSQAHILFRRIQ